MYWSGGVISREQGTIVKDWGWRLPVALVYPNTYYVGMSNLGLQVIYKLLNDRDDVVCERVFWHGGRKPPESIESARGLRDYSCLAFTCSYELDYLNIASILRTAGIPLDPEERTDDHPILMAGGPAVTANPAPLAPLFDVLAIGEAESILPSLLPVLAGCGNRRKTLKRLSALPGLYVPAHFENRRIKRQYQPCLDNFPAHSVVLTPDTELGDLYLLEVERGCSWGCRFCLVSRAFCPTRFRALDSLLRQAREGLKLRRRIGLVGPVVTDHPEAERLLQGLLEMEGGFSLSSLRLKPLPESLLALIHGGGAESIALAPEAGSDRLRKLIGKGFNENDILGAVSRAAAVGFRQLKLYFMLGLPTETDEDALDIVNLCIKCKDEAGGTARLSLNMAPFVPKAGTNFERRGMADAGTLEKRWRIVREGLKGTGIGIKSQSPEWSQVQGALSRGDSKVAEALKHVEISSLAGWRRAVRKTGLDLEFYANKDWGEKEPLPWAMVEL
jgi:radical SAM superfamily enzyme YgiQ (UPF0313 family)